MLNDNVNNLQNKSFLNIYHGVDLYSTIIYENSELEGLKLVLLSYINKDITKFKKEVFNLSLSPILEYRNFANHIINMEKDLNLLQDNVFN